MKNKVMGKALSWVLSAAMALTMSGAIPAMTSTVYAANTSVTGISYVKEGLGSTGIKAKSIINFGSLKSNALPWHVIAAESSTSGATTTYSGVVSMVADTALGTGKTATLPSTLASTILNTTESSAVVATSVTGTAVNASGATPTAAATATYYLQDVDGVSATGFYMPSFKEFVAAWSTDPTSTIGSATWTRDAVLSKAGSTYSATTKGAIIASDKSADVAADDTAYAYRPAVSIDLTKALFKVDNGDGSYHLVFVDSSLAKAPGFKAAVNATTTTTVSVNPKLGQLLIEF